MPRTRNQLSKQKGLNNKSQQSKHQSTQKQSKQETQQQKTKHSVDKNQKKQQTKSVEADQVVQVKKIGKSKDKKQKKQKPLKQKPRKQTYEQIIRIQKSKRQKIFLLTAQRSDQDWHFLVQGTKGSQYKVIVASQVKCSCIDFRIKQSPCKHIYFIVTQVGQNEELLQYLKSDKTISKKAYKLLDEQLSGRLKTRMNKSSELPQDIDLKDDKDCVICFSQMQKQTQSLENCSTCKKYFHTQCLSMWKNHNTSCPLCRSPLSSTGTDNDPLGKLIDIKI